MTLHHYMIIFSFGTITALFAWVIVLLNIDPVTSGLPGLVLFYVTLFVSMVGLFTTLGTFIRGVSFTSKGRSATNVKNQDIEHTVQVSLRQSIFLALLVNFSFILLRINMLNWWTLLLLIGTIAIFEFIAISTGKKKNSHIRGS